RRNWTGSSLSGPCLPLRRGSSGGEGQCGLTGRPGTSLGGGAWSWSGRHVATRRFSSCGEAA
ncbi:MAG: hypothetical protein M3Y56_16955, partial [Armatimonadota bacterium]|nr:hypothetical protein [Armatimonadota bacterium]